MQHKIIRNGLKIKKIFIEFFNKKNLEQKLKDLKEIFITLKRENKENKIIQNKRFENSNLKINKTF